MSRVPNVAHALRRVWPELLAVLVPALAVTASTHGGAYTDGFVDVNLNPALWLGALMHSWAPNGFLTGVDTGFWQSTIPITAVYAFWVNVLGLPLETAERIWLFVLLVGGAAATLFLIRTLFPSSRAGQLIAPSLYVVNLPILSSLKEGSTYGTAAVLALPAEIALLLLALQTGRSRPYAIAAAAINALVASSNVPVEAIILFALALTWAAWTCAHFDCVRSAFRVGAATAGMLIVFNIWWVVPFLTFMRGYYLPAFSAEGVDVQSRVSSYLNEFRGLGLFGFDTSKQYAHDAFFTFAYPYLHSPIVVLALFVPPAFALAALLFVRPANRFTVYALAGLGVLGVFLAGGAYPGSGDSWQNWGAPLYRTLYFNVPFFQAFRASYKWQILVQLWISASAAFTFAALWGRSLAKSVLALVLPVAMAIVVAPVVLIGMFSPEQHFTVPGYWREAGAYSRRTLPSDARIVAFPDQFFENYFWGETRGNITLPLLERDTFADFPGPSRSRYVSNLARAAFDTRVERNPNALRETWRLIGATHVISRSDFDWTDFAFRASALAQYRDLHFLGPPSAQFGSLRLWSLPNAQGTAYVTNGIDVLADEGILGELLRGGAPVATSVVADALDDDMLGQLIRDHIGQIVVDAAGQGSLAISLAAANAVFCTDAPGRVRLPAGAYDVVLQDRSLANDGVPAGTQVAIDDLVSPPVGQSRRLGPYVFLGERKLRSGVHACQVTHAESARDVRAFLIRSDALVAEQKHVGPLIRSAAQVASFSSDAERIVFKVTDRRRNRVFASSNLEPQSEGTLATLEPSSAVMGNVAVRSLPVVLAQGFDPSEPTRPAAQEPIDPLLTNSDRTIFLLGSKGVALVYSPAESMATLRFHAAALVRAVHLDVAANGDDPVSVLLRASASPVERPFSIGSIPEGNAVTARVRLLRGWNRIAFSSGAPPSPLIDPGAKPASAAIWDTDVKPDRTLDFAPPSCGSVGAHEASQASAIVLHVGGSNPCLMTARIAALPLDDVTSLVYSAVGSSSTRIGILLGLARGPGAPTETWLQVPLSVGNGERITREVAGDLVHAAGGETRRWVNAAVPYLVNDVGDPADAVLNDLDVTTYRGVRAIASEQSAWRFSTGQGTLLRPAAGNAVQAIAGRHVLQVRAQRQIRFDAAPRLTTLRIAYRLSRDLQPSLALRSSASKVYYPGLTSRIDQFTSESDSLTGFHRVADLPPSVPIQLDPAGWPKGMWLLRDGRELDYAPVVTKAGQWSIVASRTGFRVVLDGHQETTGHTYQIVVQPSEWFRGDGTRTVVTFPPSAFAGLDKPTGQLTVELSFTTSYVSRLLVNLSQATVLREVGEQTSGILPARIVIDGKPSTIVGDAFRPLESSLSPGRHVVRCDCLGRDTVALLSGTLRTPSREGVHIEGAWPSLRLRFAPSNGWRVVVFQQTYDPEWRAHAAGKLLAHFRANYAFNGFLIPPGVGEIDLAYETPERTLWVARSMSLLGLVAAVCSARKRRKA